MRSRAWRSRPWRSRAWIGATAAALACTPGAAQQSAENPWASPTIFSIPLGAHAKQIPTEGYTDFACGTDGGPPSRPLQGFVDFEKCRPEATGLREVYFRHDDEREFVARARSALYQIELYSGTTVYSHKVIVSALLDDQGIVQGIRIVTDPRVDAAERMGAVELSSFLAARYEIERKDCADIPPAEGERPVGGKLVKRICTRELGDGTTARLAISLLRRAGQSGFLPDSNQRTEGEFTSETRLELMRQPDQAADRATALAARSVALPPTVAEANRAKAMNCRGCNLAGLDLKRQDLSGADLRGANLAGALLHAANLTGADLTGADLTGANLNRADLRRARLDGARLTGAMLYAARLEGASLAQADLSEAMLQTAQLTRANLAGSRASLADLRGVRLADADLSGADLSGSRLDEVQAVRANLSGVTATDAVFTGAVLRGSNLGNGHFARSDFYGADLGSADLSNADFSAAKLHTAILFGARQEETDFTGATMPDGSISREQPTR